MTIVRSLTSIMALIVSTSWVSTASRSRSITAFNSGDRLINSGPPSTRELRQRRVSERSGLVGSPVMVHVGDGFDRGDRLTALAVASRQ